MGTLMPTMPTSTSFWKRQAAAVVGEDGGAVAVGLVLISSGLES